MNTATDKVIVFFDGVCNFCDNTVQFILKRDRKDIFRFTPIQSEKSMELLGSGSEKPNPTNLINPQNPDSIIVLVNGKIYKKSSAALMIANYLGGFWKLFLVFWIVPKFIRDALYTLFAKNRYKWFGKKDSCMIPTPEQRAKFL